MKIKNITSSIIYVSFFLISAFTQAESVKDFCSQQLPYPKTCMPVENSGEKNINVIIQYYNNGISELLTPGTSAFSANFQTEYDGTNITVTNLDNKILFNGFVKNYTGLNCTETRCDRWA